MLGRLKEEWHERIKRRGTLTGGTHAVATATPPSLDSKEYERVLWGEVEEQRRWQQLSVTPSSFRLRPTFDLLQGRITGYEQSVHRDPPSSCGEVSETPRGDDDGGLSKLLTVPPGWERGVHFDTQGTRGQGTDATLGAIITGSIKGIGSRSLGEMASQEVTRKQGSETESPIDGLLPQATAMSAVPRPRLARRVSPPGWARPVNIDHIPPDYDAVIGNEPAMSFPFTLDPFQRQAIYHLERGESVFVAAHTSAGKTVVADYAIALARRHHTKTIYTSPIKALSNQKFRDFRQTFPADDVGLLTGDIQVNPTAACLIMTTEILRSMLYRNADVIGEVEFVIFDEVHYVNDAERGVVWEEVIIMLPAHVTLILLSATIPNTMQFADWVGRTKKKEIFVISTTRRPVPLEHYLFVDKKLVRIVDQERRFLEPAYKEALTRKGSTTAASTGGNVAMTVRGVRQEQSLWMDVIYTLRKQALLPVVIFVFSKRKCEQNADALANLDLCTASEKSAIHLFLQSSLAKLRREDDRQLPQIGRMRELLSRGIAVHHGGLLPLLKEAVEILFSRGLVRVLFATETFAMGVNMPARTVVFSSLRKHDGLSFRGLLPGEYTQMAGRAGRRGLDATGTVIIATTGGDLPAELTLRSTILGTPGRLVSQFRLTYGMILNLLRVQALRVEEMIKASFSEHAGQLAAPEEERALQESKRLLEATPTLCCSLCEPDIGSFYATLISWHAEGRAIHRRLMEEAPLGKTSPLIPGRILLLRPSADITGRAPNDGVPPPPSSMLTPAILLTIHPKQHRLSCLALTARPDRGRAEESDDRSGPPLSSHSLSSSAAAGVVELAPPSIPPLHGPTVLSLPPKLSSVVREAITADDIVIITDCVLNNVRANTISPPNGGTTEQDRHLLLQDELVRTLSDTPVAELSLPVFRHSLSMEAHRLKRQHLTHQLSVWSCVRCPDLPTHLALFHNRHTLVERLAELTFRLSDSGLVLLPEYRARLAVLRVLGYVEGGTGIGTGTGTETGIGVGGVTVKGRVAAELNTVHELLTTELLFDNAFGALEPAEIVALMSAMVFQEKRAEEMKGGEDGKEDGSSSPFSTVGLREGWRAMQLTAERLLSLTREYAPDAEEVSGEGRDQSREWERERGGGDGALLRSPLSLAIPLNPELIEIVYLWAQGKPFTELTSMTTVLEGSIVRCIVRLDETCRELRGAARIMGDPALANKMEVASQMIKRDICFASSLYI